MDIVIVLDGSNSIYPWYEVQDFLINILHKFYIGPGQTQVGSSTSRRRHVDTVLSSGKFPVPGFCFLQVGVVQYGSAVVHEFSLDKYQTAKEVVEAAKRISQRGGEETRTALGINVARYGPDRKRVEQPAARVHTHPDVFGVQVGGVQARRPTRSSEGDDRDHRRRIARQPAVAAGRRRQREGQRHHVRHRCESPSLCTSINVRILC